MALPPDLTTITVTDTYSDLSGKPLGGSVTFTPTSQLADAAGNVVFVHQTVTATVSPATGTFSVTLPCTDNDLEPAGWAYTVQIGVPGIDGTAFTALFPSSLGASVQLRTVAPSVPPPPPLGTAVYSVNGQSGAVTLGPAQTGSVPLAGGTMTGPLVLSADPSLALGAATKQYVDGHGGGGSGTVTGVSVASANGFAGTVANPTTNPALTLETTVTGLLIGNGTAVSAAVAGTDYDAAGAASTAQSNAESFATSAVATETSRAETAEALLAPKASPALTGTPTAPTGSALSDSTQIATTAYADSAVAVETSRAETAEALKAPLASPALTGSPTAPTQTTGDNTTKIATDAFVTTAVATETTRAEAAEALLAPLASPALTGSPTAPTKTSLTNNTDIATTAYADAAVSAETTRAETAEALALPKTGGTMSGAIAMGASKITGLANGTVSSDAAAFGQIPASLPPSGTAGGVLTGTYPNPGISTLNQNTTGTAANITDTLDQVPTAAANVSLGTHKITNLANGSASGDAAAFGQIPAALPPNGSAGGVLTGTYPNPSGLAATAVTNGSYTYASLTVAADGRLTAASSGTAPVTSVTAGDTSIVVGGTSAAPTIETATLDVIATDHAPAADWSNNSHKITSLANGSGAQDAAAFGQVPVIDSTAADFAPPGVASAGGSATTRVSYADHIHPAPYWIPSDNGLLIATGDPITFAATLIATAGTLYLQKLVVRLPVTITNLWYNLSASGNNTGGSTGTFTGLYAGTAFGSFTAGQLMSGSSDVGATLTTQTPVSLALTTPQAIPAGNFVWAALLCNLGTTQPTLFRGLGGGSTSGNGGLTAAAYRWATNGTGRTSLPGSITPSSNAGTTMTAWVGGS